MIPDEEEEERKVPGREGIFWAMSRRAEYYDCIVRIHGQVPFLEMDIFYLFEGRVHRKAHHPPVIERFGPEIVDLSIFYPDEVWDEDIVRSMVREDWRNE